MIPYQRFCTTAIMVRESAAFQPGDAREFVENLYIPDGLAAVSKDFYSATRRSPAMLSMAATRWAHNATGITLARKRFDG